MLPRPLQAVVFDMDGLLVDTEGPFRDAMIAAADGMGLDLPRQVFLRMIGGSNDNSSRVLQDHFGPQFDLDAFWTRCRAHVHEIFEAGIALKAGVVELLDELEAAGVPRAIATSSPHREVDRNLGPHGLKDRFQAIVAAGDYARGKPHPDPFLTAAARLGADPAHCLALEDSHNGVRAAHAAGMMTVMVPDLLEPTEEMQGLCVRIAESLHEVRDLIAAMARSQGMPS
jgi:HAD superfamily hydrolase (TIGR01509 family)